MVLYDNFFLFFFTIRNKRFLGIYTISFATDIWMIIVCPFLQQIVRSLRKRLTTRYRNKHCAVRVIGEFRR